MTNAPHSLAIDLAQTRVTITFAPAMASARVLEGKTPSEALRLVGLVHNLCAEAHRAACALACGLPPSPDSARAVMAEILREHLLVLCRTAPPLLGLHPVALPVAFSRLGAALAPGGEALRELLARALFGFAPGAPFRFEAVLNSSALAPFFAALAAREKALGLFARDVSLPADPTFFARVARDAGFVAPGDCGPLSERLMARLYEAHLLLTGEAAAAAYAPRLVQPHVAQVAAARGTLTHRATLEDGRITAYAIETPTAAMLDACGPLAAFLDALAQPAASDEAILQLGLCAFDPCLPHEVSVERRLADA